MSNSLQPHGLQHARLPCPSPTLRACSNSHPSSQWCHPTISSCIVPFSSYHQSLPVSGSLPMSLFFASGGQSIEASISASVSLMNIQDWFLTGWAGLISLLCKGLSTVFSTPQFKSINFQCSGIFTVQLSYPHRTTGKTIDYESFVSKVTSAF